MEEEENKKMAEQIERYIAYLTDIGTLFSGQFVKGTAPMQSSYIETRSGRKLSRVHLLAVVVARGEGNFAEITLDDGTGKIVARSFEDPRFFAAVQLGDIVRIIGKVRSFNEQVYLIPEIMKMITNKKWVTFHQLLIRQREKHQGVASPVSIPELTEKVPEHYEEEVLEESEKFVDEQVDEKESQPSLADEMLRSIKELDTGDGAQVETILAKGCNDGEKILQNLLEAGEIFEIRPGRIKILE